RRRGGGMEVRLLPFLPRSDAATRAERRGGHGGGDEARGRGPGGAQGTGRAVTRAGLVLLAALLPAAGADAAPFAWITNQIDDTVSVIDTATQEVVATVDVGHRPAGVVASHDGSRVYVTN